MNNDKLEFTLKYYISLGYPLLVKDFEVSNPKNHKIEIYRGIISYKQILLWKGKEGDINEAKLIARRVLIPKSSSPPIKNRGEALL